MSVPEFVDAAIQSAHNYNLWIEEYNKHHPNSPKGYAEDVVVDIYDSTVPDCLELSIKRKKLEPLQVMVKIDGSIYSTSQIEPVFFNEKSRFLRIKLHGVLPEILYNAHDIFVVSDLTFLIRKTEDWYRIYGQRLSIPSPPIEEPSDVKLPISLSEGQMDARSLAMSAPMSYIWGAPGTGKTRVVLASCLYQYIVNKRRVLLAAPTNNALDQSLIAVLDVLTAAGIPTSSVVRFGSPTSRLLEKYPEICPSAEETYAAEKESRRNILKSVISNKVKIANNYELQGKLRILFDKLQDKMAEEKRMKAIKRELKEKKAELKALESQISDKMRSCSLYSSQIHYLSESIFRFFHRKRIASLKNMLNSKTGDMVALGLEKNKCEKAIGILEEELESIEPNGLNACEDQIISLIRPVPYLFPLLGGRSALASAYTREQINSLIEKRISKLQEKIPETFLDSDLAVLQEELSAIEAELEHISNKNSSGADKSIYLCAATVDTCISSLPPDLYSFEHVFMDEAGYCSLAKGSILLGYGTPLTLLGDHMQLPPICEVDELDLLKHHSGKLKYVSYWTQSALHIEECANLSPNEIATRYFSGIDPDFTLLKKTELLKTYRFGATLAKILAAEVYTPNFSGNEDVKTELFLVDSPPGGFKSAHRVSQSEVWNIVRLSERLLSQGSDFAILTPYRAQLKELSKRLPALVQKKDEKEERILTVHASQGREWDTVILSVVDNSENPPWFTDSTNQKSRGKQIINTAISRARKRLILVCEADFWYSRRSSQLIGRLIENSTYLTP